MINKLRTLLAVSAIAVTGISTQAFGAETDPMHISVPFAFMAGKTAFPAGDYVVQEENSGIILIKGNGHNAIVLSAVGPDSNTEKASVSFERSGQGYVMKSIHGWGRISSSILPVTQSEK